MVEQLSKEQESKMSEYVTRYIGFGENTERIDLVQLEKDIEEFYQVFGISKKRPKIVLKSSPLEVWNYICEETGVKMDFVYPFISGSFDSYIFAFYDFFLNEVGIEIDSDLKQKYDVWHKMMGYGYVYPFDDYCIVSEKPTKIKRNTAGELHCDDGPAIEYSDGFAIYMLHGVRVSKEIVMTSWDKLDPKMLLKETNAEVRREIVRKIGMERICDGLNAKCIDSKTFESVFPIYADDADEDSEPISERKEKHEYELLLLDLGDGRRRPYLKMKNPSIGVFHIEGVHPDCKTVDDALKFRNGTTKIPNILT